MSIENPVLLNVVLQPAGCFYYFCTGGRINDVTGLIQGRGHTALLPAFALVQSCYSILQGSVLAWCYFCGNSFSCYCIDLMLVAIKIMLIAICERNLQVNNR